MTPNTDWWIRLARTGPAGTARLYLRELFESDHTHGLGSLTLPSAGTHGLQ